MIKSIPHYNVDSLNIITNKPLLTIRTQIIMMTENICTRVSSISSSLLSSSDSADSLSLIRA